VLKQSPFSELHEAVTQASRGERHIDRALAAQLEERAAIDAAGRVSDRERDVLRRAALGQSNKEIASALKIAVKTVEVHKTQGMRKLDLRDRSDLIRYATMQGWLSEA
jgi:DNA-binding NarL/FixJ family response regulator